jgi:hypothetical protein
VLHISPQRKAKREYAGTRIGPKVGIAGMRQSEPIVRNPLNVLEKIVVSPSNADYRGSHSLSVTFTAVCRNEMMGGCCHVDR